MCQSRSQLQQTNFPQHDLRPTKSQKITVKTVHYNLHQQTKKSKHKMMIIRVPIFNADLNNTTKSLPEFYTEITPIDFTTIDKYQIRPIETQRHTHL